MRHHALNEIMCSCVCTKMYLGSAHFLSNYVLMVDRRNLYQTMPKFLRRFVQIFLFMPMHKKFMNMFIKFLGYTVRELAAILLYECDLCALPCLL